jgi:hypothetical protein
MKRIDIIKTFLLLLSAALLVAGCSKEEEGPFTGNENYIAAFTLAKDGIILKGAVSPNTIVITAPERFSLSGATASVTISENATITPNPATVTDWDTEQTFTVTSYNGRKNTYTYSIERHLVSRSGDVVLLTQADVDAFVEEIKDADKINGSLTVGAATGQDSVYSLEGLNALKVITGGVVINATYAGENLALFENLEKTSELRITSRKVKNVRFPKLATVHSDLNIDQAIAVKTLDFPELTIIDKSLRIYYTDSLASLNFPKLQQVFGNVTIQGRGSGTQNLESINFPALQKVNETFTLTYWREVTTVNLPELSATGTFTASNLVKLEQFTAPKLETVGGTFNISTCAALLVVNLPVLKTVNGNLTLSSTAALTTIQFPVLELVTGTLTIPNATGLTTLQFPVLKYIGNELSVNLQSLVSLDVFSSLDSIGGRLYLYNLTNLTSLGLSSIKKIGEIFAYGLTNITEIDVRGIKVGTISLYGATLRTGLTMIGADEFSGKLYIGSPPANITKFPVTMQGFKKVGNMEISTTSYITDLDFSWLEEVTGLLNFSSGSAVKTISLPNLKSAGGIQISYYNALETLSMPKLEKIGGYTNTSGVTVGNFTYTVSSNIVSLTLPKLQSVVGNISITGLTATRLLETIGFPELQSLTGTLTLTGTSNTKFKDLSGFSKLSSAGGVTISNFTQMKDFSPLKNAISSFDAETWKISGCGYNPTYQDMVEGKYSN